NTIDIRLFDETYEYFFCNKTVERKNMRGKRFSLVPFPEAVRVSTVGCQYPLDKYTLTFGTFIGIRNVATQDRLRISFESGELLLFIER
ncbi:thiamine diphosphokinase, partial [Candidatus Woesebacteria bacterium]|nr:thiamine diphosphokinase [Candidatus Woesebacteria bacterium]